MNIPRNESLALDPDASEYLHCFRTDWGWCGAILGPGGIKRFCMLFPSRRKAQAALGKAAAARPNENALLAVAERLETETRAYFAGRRPSFDFDFDWSAATPFRRRVWLELTRIPYGETLTYGELAKRLGVAGGARAVGGALGANPIPLVVPCHRVVASGGRLGGFSCEGGVALKQRLLDLEGAVI